MKKLILLLFVLVSCTSTPITEAIKEQRPNILFIEVDDLTAKYLGCFGADFAKTPMIDRLAEKGVVFNNAVVQAAMCTPSRNSLITSLYPHNLGQYHNLDIKSLPKDIWTFPKALQKEGYHTIWVGKNHLLPDCKGIEAENYIEYVNKGMQTEMGFDDVYQSMGRSVNFINANKQFKENGCWEEGIDAYGDFLYQNNLMKTFLSEEFNQPTTLDPDTEFMDGHFITTAIDKLKNYKEKDPFFLWVNLSGPHFPYNAPRNYQRRFNKKNMPKIIDSDVETNEIPEKLKSHTYNKSDTYTAIMRKKYSANVTYMDDQVKRIVTYLKTTKYRDNTMIVFFSDHGIMLGDHGLVGKETLFKEVLNPALIIWFPNKFKTKRISTPVELLDLGKTVLDIAGASDTILNETPNGNSLLPLLTEEGEFAGNGIVYSEIKDFTSVFNGDYKYIHNTETSILFNLKDNPDETNNVIEDEPEMTTHLKNEMDKWLLKSGGQIKGVVEY